MTSKIISTVVAALCLLWGFACVARAQGSQSTPASIVRIKMVDAKRGWAVGNRNGREVILRTADGGLRFTDITPPQLHTPFSTDFPDEMDVADDFVSSREAWVASTRAKSGLREIDVYHTLNGGSRWAAGRAPTYHHQDVSDILIDFVNARHGFMLSTLEIGTQQEFAKSVFFTSDGGKTWQLQDSNASPNGVAWLNTLIKNYNAGRRTPGLPVEGAATGFVFQNRSSGWLTAETPREYGDDDNPVPLYHSGDAGMHWILVNVPRPRPNQDDYIEGAYQPEFFGIRKRTGVMVVEYHDKAGREYRVLYFTRNGGKSWRPSRRLVVGMDINLVDCYDSRHCWIWDDNARRLRFSPDLGWHWRLLGHSRIAPAYYYPLQFDFVSPRIGWAIFRSDTEIVNGEGVLYVRTYITTDGGHRWKLCGYTCE